MGSFNTTCFATRQTIAPGDGVVLFPIYQFLGHASTPVVVVNSDSRTEVNARGPDQFIYPDALWKPLGCALKGHYDDCGTFVLDSGDFNREQLLALHDILNTQACYTPKGSNPYHEKEFRLPQLAELANQTDTDWESLRDSKKAEDCARVGTVLQRFFDLLQQSTHSNRVFITSNRNGGQPVLFKMAVASKVAISNAGEALRHLVSIYEGGREYQSTADVYCKLTLALKQWRADACNQPEKQNLAGIGRYIANTFDRLYGVPPNTVLDDVLKISFENSEIAEVSTAFVMESVIAFFKNSHTSLFSTSQVQSLDYLVEAFMGCMVKEILTADPSLVEQTLDTKFLESVIPEYFEINDFLEMLVNLSILFTPQIGVSQDYSNSIGKAYSTWVQKTNETMPRK